MAVAAENINFVSNKRQIMKKGVKRKLSEEGGAPATSTSSTPVPVIEGMSAAEVEMIKRLAGNDPAVRKKTIRKMRKWLVALSKKFPDSPDERYWARKEIEPNMVRVWKALFYCMWMADKPLPQEQLAENISELIGIFGEKSNDMLLFVEWFFRTMAREWSWIDRYRLDKFMMLIRRVLRKTFMAMSKTKWKKEVLDGFLKIIKNYVFNHQRVPQQPKRNSGVGLDMKKPVIEPTVNCPIGLQIHITDIYLEELAKVDAEKLNSQKILRLLSPFIEELAVNDDVRVTDEIRERIFHHLMKQSDVAMDYYEGLTEGSDSEVEEEEEEAEDDDGEKLSGNEGEEDDDGLNNDEDLNQDEINDDAPTALDPRAGKVDVVLPQLSIDYEALADKLYEASSGKSVKKKNRGLLCTLAHQFREIVKGKYPLALPEEEPNTPAIPKKEIKAATRRLIESEDTTPKIRLTKKQRRREARKAAAAAAAAAADTVPEELNDTQESEDTSVFLNDSDLLDHVDDNYVSYMHEQMGTKNESSVENHVNDENIEEIESSPSKKQKKAEKNQKKEKSDKEKKKKKYKTVIELESDEIDSGSKLEELGSENNAIILDGDSQEDSVIFIKSEPAKKKQKKIRPALDEDNAETPSSDVTPRKKKKSTSPQQQPFLVTDEPKTPINKKLRQVQGSTPKPPKTPGSSARKRVSFVLARNSEHEATDYMRTISKSPAVPYDANKTPSSGPLLKTPLKKTPIRLSLNRLPRKNTLDFS